MSKSVRALWREYFDFEREILAMFENPKDNGIHIIDQIPGMEPAYKIEHRKNSGPVYHPPRHIRYIAWMATDGKPGTRFQDMKSLIRSKPGPTGQNDVDGDLKKLYKKIKKELGEEFNRMPLRTPTFKQNISSIGHSSYPAYYSEKITTEDFRLGLRAWSKFKGKSNEEIIHLAKRFSDQLRSLNIASEVNENDVSIEISGSDLIKHAGSKHVQLRMATGMQHKLRLINKDPKEDDEWVPYGFIILDGPCHFYQVKQRKTTLRIEHDATQISLPFLHKDIKFWDTTKRVNRLR